MVTLSQYLYLVAIALAILGWLGLVLLPHWQPINFWVSGLIIPLLLCLMSILLLLIFWLGSPMIGFPSLFTLDGVHAMFANRGLLPAVWITVIAMDLVVGAWMVRKARQIRMPYLYLLPCLIATFAFAGVGFVLFAIVVAIGKGWPEIAKFEGQPPINVSPVSARPEAN